MRKPLLRDRVAIVTGAAKGIGKAIALALAEEGCRVVVNYRSSRQAAEEVAAEIERSSSGRVLLARADVSVEPEVKAMVDRSIERFGSIDILVNNAGIADRRAFLDISLARWNEMLSCNLTAVFLCCRAVLPHMLKRRWGRIINISSTSGLTGGTSGAHYAASKGGVITLTKAISNEYAPHGITVNSIVPSKIETDMLWSSLDEEGKEVLLDKIPVRRFGKPEEIASLAVFLASEHGGYITGEMIVASGGYR